MYICIISIKIKSLFKVSVGFSLIKVLFFSSKKPQLCYFQDEKVKLDLFHFREDHSLVRPYGTFLSLTNI